MIDQTIAYAKWTFKLNNNNLHNILFQNAFDREEASKEGNIIPSAGVDPEYDEAVATLKDLEKQRKDYLKTQCELFKCNVSVSIKSISLNIAI